MVSPNRLKEIISELAPILPCGIEADFRSIPFDIYTYTYTSTFSWDSIDKRFDIPIDAIKKLLESNKDRIIHAKVVWEAHYSSIGYYLEAVLNNGEIWIIKLR